MNEDEKFIKCIEKENKESEKRIKINGISARKHHLKFQKAI